MVVNVISTKTLNAYRNCYPEADQALRTWLVIMKKSNFKHFSELKQIFGSADLITNDVIVFNIKGNHFRLIVNIDFLRQSAYVKWFGRHKDYNKINPSEVKHEYPPC
ncbi:mRNA interferase HigB [Maridesulfovibrio ferrireducens]|uniref:mRNA interferase HigB n=1 Tax=Maridesulfovibrio ferrireducens TaxID=246191 RepID=A0A1G9CBE5_9BACT|nr:mRNA interferase HigB [Maridesulfovibrio ferrireducens]